MIQHHHLTSFNTSESPMFIGDIVTALERDEGYLRQIEILYNAIVEVALKGEDSIDRKRLEKLFSEELLTHYPEQDIDLLLLQLQKRRAARGAPLWMVEPVVSSPMSDSVEDEMFADETTGSTSLPTNNKRGLPSASSIIPTPKRLKKTNDYEPEFLMTDCNLGSEGVVPRRIRSSAEEKRDVSISGFAPSIEIFISPDSKDFLQQVEMQFCCRDLSKDPSGRRFWEEMKRRFPTVDVNNVRSTLNKHRYIRKRTERRIQKSKSLISKKNLVAMEKLVGVKDNRVLLDEIELIYNDWMESNSKSKMKHKGTAKDFWSTLRAILPEQDVTSLPSLLQWRRQTLKRSNLAKMGLDRNGKVREHIRIRKWQNPFMMESEVNHKQFVNMLPFVTKGSFTNQVQDVKNLNKDLEEHLLTSRKGTTNKSHKGVSLGKTVVSGGVYGNKEEGISGSVHWNAALRKKSKLQRDVFTKVAAAVKEAFGKKKWFKRWMRFFKKQRPDLKKFLIPGIPCTSIWWSYDDRPYNLHHDWNTYGAAFLFCPEERAGGNIVLLNPDGDLDLAASIHMSEGKMLCGRWARSPHCNEPVSDRKKRFSFVAYFDIRIEKGDYLECFETHPTEQVVKNLTADPDEVSLQNATSSEMQTGQVATHSEMSRVETCRVATRSGVRRVETCRVDTRSEMSQVETCRVATHSGMRRVETCRVDTRSGMRGVVACTVATRSGMRRVVTRSETRQRGLSVMHNETHQSTTEPSATGSICQDRDRLVSAAAVRRQVHNMPRNRCH